MDFEINKIYYGFKATNIQWVKDIDSMCVVFEHEKSGAKLFYAKNNDNNKVFFVSFKTLPEDDCGTPHILEHSVLCGSKKYPAKDPFNELMKGSLNTYLNALTYADKTMYPIASCNNEDFKNLMDVYMDAVFNPVVIKEEKIFQQEGWRYELNNKEEPIVINGVVYNEMKGAMSSPERVLNNAINQSLFTKSIYQFESGGDPEAIPQLTFEKFVEFYNKHYSPSNGFLYLYGDMDIEQYLRHIDEEYLSHYERNLTEIKIEDEPQHSQRNFASDTFSVPMGTKTGNEGMVSLNFIVGYATDSLLALTMEILSYVLLETSASPLKKAILDKKIAESAEGWFDSSTSQMIFSIVAKNMDCKNMDLFKDTVMEALEELVKKGIDKDLLFSAINYYEFMLREADYGYKPKGLAYGMRMMNGWLNGQNPIDSIKILEHLDSIRELAKTEYFESIIKKYILENHNSSLTLVEAEEGKQERLEEESKKHLEKMKDGLSANELNKLIEETKAFNEYQNKPDDEETIAKIPVLKKEDIDKKANFSSFIEKENTIFMPQSTNGIVYTRLIFSMESVPRELISYAGILGAMIGNLDTKIFDFEKLPTEINMYTGGIVGGATTFSTPNGFKPVLIIRGKALVRNTDKLFEILEQIIFNMDYFAYDSIKKIIFRLKERYERIFENMGHVIALRCCSALISAEAGYNQLTDGIEFNDELLNALGDIEGTAKKISQVAKLIFNRENLMSVISTEEKDFEYVEKYVKEIEHKLPTLNAPKEKFEFSTKYKSEAVENGSKIVYNAKAANYAEAGFIFSGKMNVIKNIINTEFLWNEVRVKGGAYGCGCNFRRNGEMYFYSYRDPNIRETFDNFHAAIEFLANIKLTERDLAKYTLGAINAIDKPESNSEKMEIMITRYFQGLTREDVQKSRDEMLSVTEADVKDFARVMAKTMEKSAICTFGSEIKIKENSSMYEKIRKI